MALDSSSLFSRNTWAECCIGTLKKKNVKGATMNVSPTAKGIEAANGRVQWLGEGCLDRSRNGEEDGPF